MGINRRQFTLATTAAAIGAIAAGAPLTAQSVPVLKPPRLKKGDRIGLVSPAGVTTNPDDIDLVETYMVRLGLVPVRGRHVLDRYGYLAGSDQARAADINQFFADPAIAAIMPIRGDWGCARILPYLDYELIKQNPKVIIGFSDLTALLLAIHAKTGLVTFHGPHGYTSWDPEPTATFQRVLFTGETPVVTPQLPGGDRLPIPTKVITPGQAKGPLLGGNISVLSAIVGSNYLPSFSGAILFVEDVGEYTYRLDRMLTQLKLAGILEQLVGFIFGQCTGCAPQGGTDTLSLDQVLNDHIRPLGIPAWSGAPIGHLENILTLPIGVPVAIDGAIATLRYLEPGVS